MPEQRKFLVKKRKNNNNKMSGCHFAQAYLRREEAIRIN
jgi:hypothetical protein